MPREKWEIYPRDKFNFRVSTPAWKERKEKKTNDALRGREKTIGQAADSLLMRAKFCSERKYNTAVVHSYLISVWQKRDHFYRGPRGEPPLWRVPVKRIWSLGTRAAVAKIYAPTSFSTARRYAQSRSFRESDSSSSSRTYHTVGSCFHSSNLTVIYYVFLRPSKMNSLSLTSCGFSFIPTWWYGMCNSPIYNFLLDILWI